MVKVVNSNDEPYIADIVIKASEVNPSGTVITLSSDSKKDENSMEEPTKIIPQTSTFDGFGKNFKYTFQPNSFTILRIKSKK